MIDFFLDNFVWFLLPLILLQVFAWLVGKIKSRMGSESAKPPADTAEPPTSAQGKRVRAAKRRKGFGESLEKWIYCAIGAFGVGGICILLWAHIFLSSTNLEAVRNVYYFLIFIGATGATAIAVWRGFQSKRQLHLFERQMQNSHFEKAVDMATDTSEARRANGFQILRQMLITSGENFDDSTKERIDILAYFALHNFEMVVDTRNSFKKLYDGCKMGYSEKEYNLSASLYGKTHHSGVDNAVLNLWGEIVNWNRRKFDLHPVDGIFATGVPLPKTHSFIFPGVDLIGVSFLVEFSNGMIDFPDEDMYVNFSQCCFIQVEMQGAIVSYVDFSKSHLDRINYELGDKENCEMLCIGSIFDDANLIDCNFRGANFRNASFVKTTTLRTIFDEASLIDCDFRGADCENTFFIETNILRIIFDEASVLFCNFEGANLEGASFDDTNITGTNFSFATNLTPEQFKTAYWFKPDDSLLLDIAKPKFPEDWGDDFINSLARPIKLEDYRKGENDKGQGDVEGEAAP